MESFLKNLSYALIFVLSLFVCVGLSQSVNAQGSDNNPPRIMSVAFADPYIHRGVDIEAIPYAEDDEGDYISYRYRWFLNGEELLDNDTDMLIGNRFFKGDRVALWVVPRDDYGTGPTFYGSDLTVPNAPPVFETGEPIQFENYKFSFQASATDADDDVLTYSLAGAPEGMVVDSLSGLVEWTGNPDRNNPFSVQIIVTDTEGAKAVLPLEIGESKIDR